MNTKSFSIGQKYVCRTGNVSLMMVVPPFCPVFYCHEIRTAMKQVMWCDDGHGTVTWKVV